MIRRRPYGPSRVSFSPIAPRLTRSSNDELGNESWPVPICSAVVVIMMAPPALRRHVARAWIAGHRSATPATAVRHPDRGRHDQGPPTVIGLLGVEASVSQRCP